MKVKERVLQAMRRASADLGKGPARERLRDLDGARAAMADFEAELMRLRGVAVRELVDEVGATKAAAELGLSRNRVYMLMARADDE